MSEEKVLTLRGKKAVWAPGGGSGPIDPKRLPEGYPYETDEKVLVLEETLLSDGMVSLETLLPLVVGDEYIVHLDNGDYVAMCKEVVLPTGATALCLGNARDFGGEDTGENYFVVTASMGGQSMTAIRDGANGTKVSIKGNENVVVPMAPKFLPTETWTFELESGETVYKKVTIGK